MHFSNICSHSPTHIDSNPNPVPDCSFYIGWKLLVFAFYNIVAILSALFALFLGVHVLEPPMRRWGFTPRDAKAYVNTVLGA